MLFVHLIPCTMLVVLNILLFRTMKEAERKRERLLNCRQRAAPGESKESKKLRDSNCTTLMLIVVITVSQYSVGMQGRDPSLYWSGRKRDVVPERPSWLQPSRAKSR